MFPVRFIATIETDDQTVADFIRFFGSINKFVDLFHYRMRSAKSFDLYQKTAPHKMALLEKGIRRATGTIPEHAGHSHRTNAHFEGNPGFQRRTGSTGSDRRGNTTCHAVRKRRKSAKIKEITRQRKIVERHCEGLGDSENHGCTLSEKTPPPGKPPRRRFSPCEYCAPQGSLKTPGRSSCGSSGALYRVSYARVRVSPLSVADPAARPGRRVRGAAPGDPSLFRSVAWSPIGTPCFSGVRNSPFHNQSLVQPPPSYIVRLSSLRAVAPRPSGPSADLFIGMNHFSRMISARNILWTF